MGIRESLLNTITSVADSDFVRIVTSAGASSKATFANVAKYIIETYNGSTVAGSAQSVKSALDSLNSNSPFSSVVSQAVSATKNFSISGGARGLVLITSSTIAGCGMYFISTPSGGEVRLKTISQADYVTIDSSVANRLTITPASGSREVTILLFAGTASV